MTVAAILGAQIAAMAAASAGSSLRDRAKAIKLVALDVDGVLTDGGVNIGAMNGTPFEFKRYDIQDGLGIKFLQWAGLKVVVITGRISEAARLRATELAVDDFAQDNQAQKLPALLRMCEKFGVTLDDVAYVGDDWPDMAVMQRVRLPVAVANAAPEIREVALHQLDRTGGHGAVREFAEWLLKAQGRWDDVTARYVAERSGGAA